jgi:hypothetical protein
MSDTSNDLKASDKKPQNEIKSTDAFLTENNENKSDNTFVDNTMTKENESGSDGSQIQCIRFSNFQQQQWHTLLDHNHQELYVLSFVIILHNFNYSIF